MASKTYRLYVEVEIEGDVETLPSLKDVADEVSEAIRNDGMEYNRVVAIEEKLYAPR